MQLRFRILIKFTFICHLFFSILPVSAYSRPVLFITEQIPPLAYTHNGTLRGYNADLIKRIWEKMELPEHTIKIQPWPRSVKDFDSNVPTCLFPVGITAQRKQYRYVTTPTAVTVAIITHKKNEKLFDTPSKVRHARICVEKASSILPLLRKLGYTEKNFEFASSFPNNVHKFFKGRAPLIAGGISNILYNYHLIGGTPSDLRVLEIVKQVPNGFLFNNAVPQQFVDDFRKAMEEIVSSGEATEIYNKDMLYYSPSK
ncbi:substrate-binding periplasmic protein [Halodesulfovibrio aestuarii]|uniref:substrate-binding periplasmic protein n=1 Tax=Halodesulfovibrio aestuarii TaxID=126333 RepID=UPI003D32BD8E